MPSALVVGSGPNGLVGAVTLARRGWRVTVVERAEVPGGGTRTEELVEPGVRHDVCSAIHPLGLASPALRDLPLADHGLQWVHPEVPVAHVMPDGAGVLLHRSLEATAGDLGVDGDAWSSLMAPLVASGREIVDGVLSPLDLPPRHPLVLARFGVSGARSAVGLGRRFATDEARALLAGLAAHSVLPLDRPATAGYGLVLGLLAHAVGWPMARGGSAAIAAALVAELEVHGGTVECGTEVRTLEELPAVDVVLVDTGPGQLASMAGGALSGRARRRLERFRRGPGVHKVDWVLDGPVPWADPRVAGAGTVHLGGTMEDIAHAEDVVHRGRHAERPYVLFAQPTLFDPSRIDASRLDPGKAPEGTQVAWAYCHVPNGSPVDATAAIEAQVERAAPGFTARIRARHVMGPLAMEAHNPNLVGGDITGGLGDLRQLVVRPSPGLHPWRTPVAGVYLCSSSTPPGGGVHGMCGLHAARTALADHRRGARFRG